MINNCMICASDEAICLDVDEQPSLKIKAKNCKLNKILGKSLSTKVCYKCAYEIDQCNQLVNNVKKSCISKDTNESCCVLCLEKDTRLFDLSTLTNKVNGFIERVKNLFEDELKGRNLNEKLVCLACRYCVDLLVDLRSLSEDVTEKLRKIKNGTSTADLPKTRTSIVNRSTTFIELLNFNTNTPSDTESEASDNMVSKRKVIKTSKSRDNTISRKCRQCKAVCTEMYRIYSEKISLCKGCWLKRDPGRSFIAACKSRAKARKRRIPVYIATPACSVLLYDILQFGEENRFVKEADEERSSHRNKLELKKSKPDLKVNEISDEEGNTEEDELPKSSRSSSKKITAKSNSKKNLESVELKTSKRIRKPVEKNIEVAPVRVNRRKKALSQSEKSETEKEQPDSNIRKSKRALTQKRIVNSAQDSDLDSDSVPQVKRRKKSDTESTVKKASKRQSRKRGRSNSAESNSNLRKSSRKNRKTSPYHTDDCENDVQSTNDEEIDVNSPSISNDLSALKAPDLAKADENEVEKIKSTETSDSEEIDVLRATDEENKEHAVEQTAAENIEENEHSDKGSEVNNENLDAPTNNIVEKVDNLDNLNENDEELEVESSEKNDLKSMSESKSQPENNTIYDCEDDESKAIIEEDEPYTCSVCDKVYESRYFGLQHELTHKKKLEIKLCKYEVPEIKIVGTDNNSDDQIQAEEIDEPEKNMNVEGQENIEEVDRRKVNDKASDSDVESKASNEASDVNETEENGKIDIDDKADASVANLEENNTENVKNSYDEDGESEEEALTNNQAVKLADNDEEKLQSNINSKRKVIMESDEEEIVEEEEEEDDDGGDNEPLTSEVAGEAQEILANKAKSQESVLKPEGKKNGSNTNLDTIETQLEGDENSNEEENIKTVEDEENSDKASEQVESVSSDEDLECEATTPVVDVDVESVSQDREHIQFDDEPEMRPNNKEMPVIDVDHPEQSTQVDLTENGDSNDQNINNDNEIEEVSAVNDKEKEIMGVISAEVNVENNDENPNKIQENGNDFNYDESNEENITEDEALNQESLEEMMHRKGLEVVDELEEENSERDINPHGISNENSPQKSNYLHKVTEFAETTKTKEINIEESTLDQNKDVDQEVETQSNGNCLNIVSDKSIDWEVTSFKHLDLQVESNSGFVETVSNSSTSKHKRNSKDMPLLDPLSDDEHY